jgi:hypothetical protein
MISLANAERAIRRLYRAGDSLPTYDRFPFSDPMEDVLNRTVSSQKRWIKSTDAFLIPNQGSSSNQVSFPGGSISPYSPIVVVVLFFTVNSTV